MKTTAKRTLSLFLVLALCLSLGLSALAAGEDDEDGAVPVDETFDFYVNIDDYGTLVQVGDTLNLGVHTVPLDIPAGASVNYSWSSSNSSVASVSGNGNAATVRGGSAGSAVITCSVTVNGVTQSDSVTITVEAAESHWISITADRGPYTSNAIVQVSVQSDLADVDMSRIQWNSSPAGYLQSNGDGTFTVTNQDTSQTTVTISASYNLGGSYLTDNCTVSIAAARQDPLTLSGGGTLTMNLNATQTLTGTPSGGSGKYYYVWEHSGGVSLTNESSSSGSATVRADSAPNGTVTLTVYDQGQGDDFINYASVTWSITVNSGAQITGVTMSPTSITMDTYSSRYLSLTVTPSSASYTVTWSSSNTNIATVSGSNASATVSTSGREGSATITAAVRDNSTGTTTNATCTVYVNASSGTYNPSLSITLGSDYYGTSISDSIYNQFFNLFGVRLNANATVRFSNAGNTTYGQLLLSGGGAVRANTTYTFNDLQNMSFTPYQAGTFSIPYSVTYNSDTLSGTIYIYIRGANLTVSLSKTALSLPTYSSQYLDVSVVPSTSYYRVFWSSSNNNIATVSGTGTRATVTSRGTAGSVTISATVTDSAGIQVVRRCTVTVTNAGSTYSPSKVVTIGTNVTGTTLADALANQYKNVYGTALNNATATIRFSALGDGNVAVRRLANGTAMTANTNYTFQQYIDCYTDPVSEGTLTTPYTLTYNGKTLSGNLIVEVHAAQVNAGITLPDSSNPYSFSTSLSSGGTGASQITSGLNSALASASSAAWSYARFSTSSSQAGTLYASSGRAALTSTTNMTADTMANLYFVPTQSGTFTSAYTAYNASGGVVARGTLTITVPGSSSTTPSPSGGLRVQLSNQSLTVNGTARNTQVYNINDENYFRLRDIAYMLNGTGSQFAVGYNDAMRTISLSTGQAYSSLGNEMSTGQDYSSTCVVSNMPVLINGTSVSLTAYNINDNTFYRLRDLGDNLNFNVSYDANTRTVVVTSR